MKPTVFISVPKKWMELHEAAVWEAGSDDPDELAAAPARHHRRPAPLRPVRRRLPRPGRLPRVPRRRARSSAPGYGMTEATGGITMTPAGRVRGRLDRQAAARDRVPPRRRRRAAHPRPVRLARLLQPEPRGAGRDAGRAGSTPATSSRSTPPATSASPAARRRSTRTARARRSPRSASRTCSATSRRSRRRSWSATTASTTRSSSGRTRPRRAVAGKHAGGGARAPLLARREREPLPRAVRAGGGVPGAAARARRGARRAHAQAHLQARGGRGELEAAHREDVRAEAPRAARRRRVPAHPELGAARDRASSSTRSRSRATCSAPRDRTLARRRVARRRPARCASATSPTRPRATVVDLGALLSRPALWLGNEALRALPRRRGLRLARARGGGRAAATCASTRAGGRRPRPSGSRSCSRPSTRGEPSFRSIHAAGELLRAERPEARRAIAHLHLGLARGAARARRASAARCCAAPPTRPTRTSAAAPSASSSRTRSRPRRSRRCASSSTGWARSRCATRTSPTSASAASPTPRSRPSSRTSPPTSASAAPRDPSDRRLLVGAMRLVTATAIAHPVYFARVRVPLARLDAPRRLRDRGARRRGAGPAAPRLLQLGRPEPAARHRPADRAPSTAGRTCSSSTRTSPPAAQHHLLQALEDTTIVRASVFLLGRGVLLSLADIPPGGAAVSLLGRQHGKSVYRLSIHTRAREVFDVAINVAEDMNFAELRAGGVLAARRGRGAAARRAVRRLLRRSGGSSPRSSSPGDTVERQVARLVRQGEPKRLRSLWPFLVWTALEGHVRFWDRTGRRLALREPSPAAFIVPSHDYQTGARLVSISDRTPCTTLDELLDRFQRAFVARIEAVAPGAARRGRRRAPASPRWSRRSAPERGVALLSRGGPGLAARGRDRDVPRAAARARASRRSGSASPSRRYRRWLEVNPAATVEAQGKMLGELWGTYRLARGRAGLARHAHPLLPPDGVRATRARSSATALDRLMQRARTLPAGGLDLEEQVAALRGAIAPTAEEDYFLARMTYRYLAPDRRGRAHLACPPAATTSPRWWSRSPTRRATASRCAARSRRARWRACSTCSTSRTCT